MFLNLFYLLVLDRRNLPIKLGLPIFLNLRRYPNLLCQLLSLFIASLFHSLFSTDQDFYLQSRLNHDYTNGGNAILGKYENEHKCSYKLGNWHKLGICIMACS